MALFLFSLSFIFIIIILFFCFFFLLFFCGKIKRAYILNLFLRDSYETPGLTGRAWSNGLRQWHFSCDTPSIGQTLSSWLLNGLVETVWQQPANGKGIHFSLWCTYSENQWWRWPYCTKKKSSVPFFFCLFLSLFYSAMQLCISLLSARSDFILHVATHNISLFYLLEKKYLSFCPWQISKRIYCQNAKKLSLHFQTQK